MVTRRRPPVSSHRHSYLLAGKRGEAVGLEDLSLLTGEGGAGRLELAEAAGGVARVGGGGLLLGDADVLGGSVGLREKKRRGS